MKVGCLALWLAIGCACAGCKSARERCELARSAASTAFGGYVDELDQKRGAIAESIEKSKRTLMKEVEPRIAGAARANADRLYQAGSDAWMRGYHVAHSDLCMKDRECSRLKHGLAQSESALKDLDERLSLARAALTAIDEDLAKAKARAQAAILDPERPSLKAAQAAVDEALSQCKDVPAEEPE